VRALGRDFHFQALIFELPFDEGRSKCILRSSAENPLPSAESQVVRRPVGGYRKGPAHLAACISYQEEQMPLQVLEQVSDMLNVEP
jgi:hypothetical protein